MSLPHQYNQLLAFDLSSYGAAFAIINQYVDDEVVKVFEVSPSGPSAILILLCKEIISLQIIKSQVASIYSAQILSVALIENIHEELLLTYLSQNKTKLKKSLAIYEGSFVSMGLVLAQKALVAKNSLIDFRVIRTFPKNVVLTVSVDSLGQLVSSDAFNFKKTYIENIQPSLRSFYEITDSK